MTNTARGSPAVGPLLPSNRNKIINGCFRVWQRGTNFVQGALVGSYGADRWILNNYTNGQVTFSKETTILPDGNTSACLKAACNTIDTSIANQFVSVYQYLEGYNFLPLWNKTCVLSFWARSNKTGTYCVTLANTTSTFYSYLAEISIDVANTWKKCFVILPIAPGGGTWGFTNGAGCVLFITLDCGSGNFIGNLGWQSDATYQKLATANQAHFMDTNTNVFYLANVQLEALDATTFEDRDIGEEIRLCKRYYLKGYYPNEYPGQAGATPVLQVLSDTLGYGTFNFQLPVEMRATPVFHSYASATGTIDKFTNASYSGAPDCTASFGGTQTTALGYMYNNQTGNQGYWLRGNYTIEAEL